MNLYQIDVRIVATAYIRAKSAKEARQIANDEFKDTTLTLSDDGAEVDEGPEVCGLPFDHPDLPDVSLSPCMTLAGPIGTASLTDEA